MSVNSAFANLIPAGRVNQTIDDVPKTRGDIAPYPF